MMYDVLRRLLSFLFLSFLIGVFTEEDVRKIVDKRIDKTVSTYLGRSRRNTVSSDGGKTPVVSNASTDSKAMSI